MRRRSLATLGFAAAGATALGGCGASASARGSGPVRLTLLSHYANAPLKPGLAKLIDEFNRTHRTVQVTAQGVNFDSLLETVTVRQAAGRGADIIQPYGLWAGQFAEAGVLVPAPKGIAEEIRAHYSKAAVGAATVDGTLYGYPTETQTYGLYYNKRLVPTPPSTWDELESAARKATKRDRHGNIVVQGFGVSKEQDSNVVHPFLSLLQSAGGHFLEPGGTHTAVDSAAARSVLDLECGLIRARVTDPGTDMAKAYPSGLVGMTINAGWWLGALPAMMGGSYKDVGTAPIPGPRDGARGSLAYGYFMGVNAQSRHQDAAWEFLTWLNRGKSRGARATRMGTFQYSVGTIPPRPADTDALTEGTKNANLATFAAALEYATPEPNINHGQQIKAVLQKNIEAAWTGQAAVPDALRTTAEQVDNLLAR